MHIESSIAVKDHKEKGNPLAEVSDVERQLWTYVHSRGLVNADVQNLYRKACGLYEQLFLRNNELKELQEIEYSLWKLHYKHIDEFRKRTSQNSGKGETETSKDPENLRKGLKLFLGESSKFYQDLIGKIKRFYGFQEPTLFYNTNDVSSSADQAKLHKCRFLCHHLFVRLGDLARYLEAYGRPGIDQRNWSAAAKCYLEAAKMYPDGGNPHNQLAWLAKNIGDELLALYHCLRSLAVKEPFPDASDNLTVIFEMNQSTNIDSLSSEAEFNFLKPSERVIMSATMQVRDGASHCSALRTTEDACSMENDFWPLIVRMTSFFFLDYSLESFSCTFGSTIRAMEALLALNDAKLSSALESYQNVNLSRPGPYRALQVVSILIFTIQSLGRNAELQSLKLQMAFTVMFIILGRILERCLQGNSVDNSPLLPAVMVFSEWFVGVLDKVEKSETDEKLTSAMSYFFSLFAQLLNRLVDCQGEVRSPNHVALWEDYEMRGYKPISESHSSLDFSSHRGSETNFRTKNEYRVHRIIQAAIEVANRSIDDTQSWIMYEKGGRFCMKEQEVCLQRKRLEVEEKLRSDSEPKESYQLIKGDVAMMKENDACMKSKSVMVEEEEDIVFKPITRYNSAPLSSYLKQKEGTSQESAEVPQPPASDECLRRASSMLIAQNRALIDSMTSPAAVNVTHPKSSMLSSVTEVAMSSAGPGPPSLSAWVLNGEKISKIGESSNLKRIDELASDSLNSLSVDNKAERFGFVSSTAEDLTSIKCSSPHCNYSAPTPSAPLLPEDATWFSGISGPKVSSFIHHSPSLSGPTAPPPPPQWLHLLRQNPNLHWVNNQNIGMQQHQNSAAPMYAGNFYNPEPPSRFDLLDVWGYPLTPIPAVYKESMAPLPSSAPFANGLYDQRRENMLFHHNGDHERALPYARETLMDVRADQQQLLRYLKENELRIQQDAQVTRSTYARN